MDQVWVVVLASAPFSTFTVWALWWLVSDTLTQRRRARAAAHVAQRFGPTRAEPANRRHAPAA